MSAYFATRLGDAGRLTTQTVAWRSTRGVKAVLNRYEECDLLLRRVKSRSS